MIETLYLIGLGVLMIIIGVLVVISLDAYDSYCNQKKDKSKPYYSYRILQEEDDRK